MGSLADAAKGGEGEVVQDVLVPWVVKPGPGEGRKARGGPGAQTGRGRGAKANTERRGEEGDGGAAPVEEEGAAGEKKGEESAPEGPRVEEDKVYNRYYHLFVKGELRELVERAAADEGFKVGSPQGRYMRVVSEGWEADNWWIEGEVGLA